VISHRQQLKEYWKVKKNDTDFHKLKFNCDYENPLILIQGWNKFKEFNDLPKNVQIVMIYWGNNFYQVDEILDLDANHSIPSFHSRSLHPNQTTFFDVDITAGNIHAPKLVRILNRLSAYIFNNILIEVDVLPDIIFENTLICREFVLNLVLSWSETILRKLFFAEMREKNSASTFSTRQMLIASKWGEIGMISAMHRS
jgi:hypothetical protein